MLSRLRANKKKSSRSLLRVVRNGSKSTTPKRLTSAKSKKSSAKRASNSGRKKREPTSESEDESVEEHDNCQDLRVPGDIFGNEEVGDYFVDSQGYGHVRTRKDTALALS